MDVVLERHPFSSLTHPRKDKSHTHKINAKDRGHFYMPLQRSMRLFLLSLPLGWQFKEITMRNNLTWIEDMIVFQRHHLSCLPYSLIDADCLFLMTMTVKTRKIRFNTHTLESVQEFVFLIVGQFERLSITSHDLTLFRCCIHTEMTTMTRREDVWLEFPKLEREETITWQGSRVTFFSQFKVNQIRRSGSCLLIDLLMTQRNIKTRDCNDDETVV
jgi:hypothetical protein